MPTIRTKRRSWQVRHLTDSALGPNTYCLTCRIPHTGEVTGRYLVVVDRHFAPISVHGRRPDDGEDAPWTPIAEADKSGLWTAIRRVMHLLMLRMDA